MNERLNEIINIVDTLELPESKGLTSDQLNYLVEEARDAVATRNHQNKVIENLENREKELENKIELFKYTNLNAMNKLSIIHASVEQLEAVTKNYKDMLEAILSYDHVESSEIPGEVIEAIKETLGGGNDE